MQGQATGDKWGLSTHQPQLDISPYHLAASVPTGVRDQEDADTEMLQQSWSKVSRVSVFPGGSEASG